MANTNNNNARAAGVEALRALKQLRSMCPHADGSIACRVPDVANCAGCETGELAGATPIEHCCADSCPACNRSASRCVPPHVFRGDPLAHDPQRRVALESYLGQKDKHLPAEIKQWRSKVGRPRLAKQQAAEKAAARTKGAKPGGRLAATKKGGGGGGALAGTSRTATGAAGGAGGGTKPAKAALKSTIGAL